MYEIIKKQNGERFAKAIRNYDNGIFDVPNIDKIVKYAGREAEPIMNYLVSLKQVRIEEMAVHMNPIMLLKKAGYDAYVADTLQKQNAIKKYFVRGEELCTFNDPYRFENYYIINAVHENAENLNRASFADPEREDEYGTSVISIQVLKDGGFISIKNRYNHTVENPDNTFNSNPDNIIPGLSDAIKHYFDVDFSAGNVALPRGFVMINNQICRYNSEINNIYFGSDFFAKDGVITRINTQYEIMLGRGIILNLQTKQAQNIAADEPDGRFVEDAIRGKKIQIANNLDGSKSLVADGKTVIEVKNGEIVYVNTPDAEEINLDGFKKLRGPMDCSRVKRLKIMEANFAKAGHDIIFNPNAEEIRVSGFMNMNKRRTFNFGNVKRLITTNMTAEKMILNPNAEEISLQDVQLNERQSFDFSGVKKLNLSAGYNINVPEVILENTKFNPRPYEISLASVLLKSDILLQHIENLTLRELTVAPEARIEIKQAEHVHFETVEGMQGQLDFSGVENLVVDDINLKKVTELKLNPKAYKIHLQFRGGHNKTTFFADKVLDLSGVRDIFLNNIIGIKQLKLNPNAKSVIILDVINIHGAIDASNVDLLRMCDVKLSGDASIKINPNASQVELKNVKGLRGVLDFSNVSLIDLTGTDLSEVTEIKTHPNAHITGNMDSLLKKMNQNALLNGISVIEQRRIQQEKINQQIAKGKLIQKPNFLIDTRF